MCYLEGHSPDCCPWLYTKCRFPHCDGIRKLMTSYTTKNYTKNISSVNTQNALNFSGYLMQMFNLEVLPGPLLEVGVLGVMVHLIGLEISPGKNPNVKYKVVLGQGCSKLLGKIIIMGRSI
ncbi:hypothetical protein GIB67_035402 [Kingdonia uniflora]|uniref:Uncharacterized protein n=1 Tax=Kingdonia uniflora TaxID=39325 RepID=A0A7J7P0Z1_9MAGN|nr:hypothetical protein GIB67_035402 [Kingdonia uniflora]